MATAITSTNASPPTAQGTPPQKVSSALSDTFTFRGDKTQPIEEPELLKPLNQPNLTIVQPNINYLQIKKNLFIALQNGNMDYIEAVKRKFTNFDEKFPEIAPYISSIDRQCKSKDQPLLRSSAYAKLAGEHFRKSLDKIEWQLNWIKEDIPTGFYGIFNNLPVLRKKRTDSSGKETIEKWFYLGKTKEVLSNGEVKEGYSFINVINVNGQRGLNYKFYEWNRKENGSPVLTTGKTLDEATIGFKGPDFSNMPKVKFKSNNPDRPIIYYILGKLDGKYNLIKKHSDGSIEVRKNFDVDKLVAKGLAELEKTISNKSLNPNIPYLPKMQKPNPPKIQEPDLPKTREPIPPKTQEKGTGGSFLRKFTSWF